MENDTRTKMLALVAEMQKLLLAEDTPAPGPIEQAKPITAVALENLGGEQRQIPFTFAQVFAPGDLPAGMGLIGLGAGDRSAIPLQTDVKALHPDGSVRHAIISGVFPYLTAGASVLVGLAPADAENPGVLNIGSLRSLDAHVMLTIDGVQYTASADKALTAGQNDVWLDGPLAVEMGALTALLDGKGNAHPHLAVRFAARWYAGTNSTRVEVVLENTWAYEPNPQNFTYDVYIEVAGKTYYRQSSLTHYHHARWRFVGWIGEAPAVHVRHDVPYLIASRAVPNYDQSIVFGKNAMDDLAKRWDKAEKGPMDTGLAMRAMPTTGGRQDIGLMPAWAATYLLTMDATAKDATLITGELAGSYSMHYRDKATGRPMSLEDYPYATLLGNPGDTKNPATGQREMFPAKVAQNSSTPNRADVSHHPALSYLPYLVTGDYYHLEELQFWAMFAVFNSNPGWRENKKGLLSPEQVRGQAWGLRTLAEAAYITPDADRLKPHFLRILDANLDWYNSTYVTGGRGPHTNALGFIANGYAVVYRDKTAIGPWQDDFFTAAVGHVAELGFKKAETLLAFKIKFPIERMVGEGACWVGGSEYEMKVRDSETGPFYTTIKEMYAATSPKFTSYPCGGAEMAKALGLKPGEMSGYPSSPTGYPANMQPALAYAAQYGGVRGGESWELFQGRASKPDYSLGPQFAIVPRTVIS